MSRVSKIHVSKPADDGNGRVALVSWWNENGVLIECSTHWMKDNGELYTGHYFPTFSAACYDYDHRDR